MMIKNENKLLALGMFSITLSILIGSVNVEGFGFLISDFVRGILIGISLALNPTYLITQVLRYLSGLSQYNIQYLVYL